MKIKRFFAKDVRRAIHQVRTEMGPDAVILSNRQVLGGIEIVAAIDYDEALIGGFAPQDAEPPPALPGGAEQTDRGDETPRGLERPPRPAPQVPQIVWSQEPTLVEMRSEIQRLRGILEHQVSGLVWGDFTRRHPLHARLLRSLMTLGLHPSLCKQVADQAAQTNDFTQLWREALGIVAGRLPIAEEDILSDGGIVALVGPTGVGKTTMVAKLAARSILRHGARSVALVSTDNYRIGAHDQLRTYGRIIGVPVRTAGDKEQLRESLADLADKRLVLIDTAGMSQRDQRLTEQLAAIHDAESTIRTYLVMAGTSYPSGLDEIVSSYKSVNLHGCILTKLDETTSLGGALSIAVKHALPIAYVGDGQRVPEDLHRARSHNLVNRCVATAREFGEQPDNEILAEAFGSMTANAYV